MRAQKVLLPHGLVAWVLNGRCSEGGAGLLSSPGKEDRQSHDAGGAQETREDRQRRGSRGTYARGTKRKGEESGGGEMGRSKEEEVNRR